MELLDGNEKLVMIKEISVSYLGSAETETVWADAGAKLQEILSRYENIPEKEQRHTNLIFPHIAVYKALLERHGDAAMEIMEQGEAKAARKSAKTYQNLVKIPFGKAIFLKAFAAGCKSGFGPEAGFQNKVHRADTRVYQMDILACPYAKYCNAENCGELTHIFCNNDIYAYGSLKGITFTRHETLGTGGEKCDFLFERNRHS